MGKSPLEVSGLPLFFRVGAADPSLRPSRIPGGIGVRTVARSLSTMQKEALVATGASQAIWRLASDEGPYLLGDDVAPPPLAFFSVGLVTDFAEALQRGADSMEGAWTAVRIQLDTRYTMKGSASQGTLRAGALSPELSVEGDLPEERIQEAVRTASAYGLVRSGLVSRFSLVHNGRPLKVLRVMPADTSVPADPDRLFDQAAPAEAPGVVERDGPTPKTEEDTSYQGSSLAETQDRTLHLQAICTRTPEGLWHVEQRMYNPRGTIFRFLCDPSGLRAPDPLAYLSAGIAFCFMTQLARFAKIRRKALRACRVVQDTGFRAGGDADPVVTHVFLDTDEDDAFAEEILAMGEQTCFLHALCRTELDVRIRLHAV
ncbi:MAG: OsmC family protein [Armatimonadota bacterium]|nr:OsmC family protein [Armatimonadota bacterium]MDR7444541.1 OsmC family protein [Armatimonadota bacterium]MDR7570310.1 OsmC family protein [Armatimonadota bacterium]MDR7615332.1 OsmC family protein [Armatimonadota bacterium]